MYDAVARYNESIIATIDAIDTALVAVLAGNVAVIVFTIEKIAGPWSWKDSVAMSLLAGSILCCAVGYAYDLRPRVNRADGVRPRLLVADVAARADESIVSAVAELIDASEINLTVRFVKRVLTIVAIALLLAALAVVAVARAHAYVVY